jgi:predicted metal-binding membrane protein
LNLHALRGVAFRSLRARRDWGMAVFLGGYFAPWAALGLPVAYLRRMPWTHTHAAAAGAFVVAGAWVLTPLRERAFVACHVTAPLAPSGLRGTRDATFFGARVGGACAGSCWAVMLACALTGHSLVAMVGGAAIGAVERLSFRPSRAAVIAGNLALASIYVAMAISG